MIYKTGSSNVIFSDFPDPDVIRVDDTYYMVSTTMHFFPGCVILRSYNLLDWEFCSYVYDELDNTEGQTLQDNKGIYGKGMWAASLRFHKGTFYVSFVCNDTHKTYLYTSNSIQGPWKKTTIPGFYHDMSILFDDDDRVYIVSGNTEIQLTEMNSDLSGVKVDGIQKVIVQDDKNKINLGYEGSHFYKINGKYYIFFIHMPKDKMRTEACFVSDKIDGPYIGGDVLCSDLGNWNSGTAQGGIVQTPDEKWFSIVFQDHGALGRIPVLIPVNFDAKGFPIFGEKSENGEQIAPKTVKVLDNRPDYKYSPLFSNDFTNPAWQFNHTPNYELVDRIQNVFKIKTNKLVKNITQATNTLTQRTFTENCAGSVTLDASELNQGDYAGLCALEGQYAFIGITKKNQKFYLVTAEHQLTHSPWAMNVFDQDEPTILCELPIDSPIITIKLDFDLGRQNMSVKMQYFDSRSDCFKTIGTPSKLIYSLDQFVGVRFALFCYSTETTGGSATFKDFNYSISNTTGQ